MDANEVATREALVILFALVLVASVMAYLFVRMRRSLRRRGYHSPFVSWYLGFACVATLALATVAGTFVSDVCWSCSADNSPEHFDPERSANRTMQYVAGMLGASAAGVTLTALAIWLMPRGQRRAGKRRAAFPWQGCAYLCLALIAVVIVMALAGYPESDTYKRFKTAFQLNLLLVTGYAVCHAKARQETAASLDELLAQDKRPPVLYLRPFEREDDAFAYPTNAQCRALDIPVRHPQALRQTVTFEAYLARPVQTQLGPFVALGNPADYLPPLGAARKYFSDEAWRESFMQLLATSVCLLTTIGQSDNLTWEMQAIRTSGYHAKLFILTRPLQKLWWQRIFSNRDKAIRREWSAFAEELMRCGLTLGDYPGDGATVGFDEGGHAQIVAMHARSPYDYVAAIVTYLNVSTAPTATRRHQPV